MSQQEVLLRDRLREAATVLREVRLERDALLRERTEPIAIVGMGCRFPGGAHTPQALWELLESGRDAVVPMEPRWKFIGTFPDEQVPRWAGLIAQQPDAFDPAFFGIAPREARALDPQQRLLLEVAWECLEDAGIPPLSLKESKTGVFIGSCARDYADLAAKHPSPDQDAYLTTGNMQSIAAGRLSYTLALQGPCFTVDTACSSSLVAIHLACRSLRSRESDFALAGGVNMILYPDCMTALSRTQALSPDGRCRTFDAMASGYARGEGCGIIVLKRLSDAQRDGDRIWAIIRGSAVNQDGRSTGLTAPNVRAQESLIRDALKDAGVDPDSIGYVETHGTGTALGDPIEVQALTTVLGKPRPDGKQCILGALKTNLGHLEGAAGVASVIKTALLFAKERIPKNLHFRALNAHIDLAGTCLALANAPLAWPRSDRPRIAGVSGFGLGGTNAHIVMAEAPAAAIPQSVPADVLPFLISGKTESALKAQAAQLAQHLSQHEDATALDVAYALACRRSHLEHRASIVCKTREELHAALGALAQSTPHAAVRTGIARGAGKLAFLFTGQGSQRPGMGRELAAASPVFRTALDQVVKTINPLLPEPLDKVLFAPSGTPEAQLIDQTGYTQPALFALQVALFRLVESLGVVPDMLFGHSVGEIAAAHVAGVFSLPDACRLVVARGRLMQALPVGGAMVALTATEEEVRPFVSGRESLFDLAALNGPRHTVISGEESAVLEVTRHFEALGRKCTRLSVSHAFHSPRMDQMAASFAKLLADISFFPPRCALVSSVSGLITRGDEMCRPQYWVKQARATVRFHQGMASLSAEGVRSYLELGPRGVLSAMGAECLSEAVAERSDLVPILRGDIYEPTALLQALGRLHVRGVAVDFGALLRPMQPKWVDLPTYPFQRQRYWIDISREQRRGAAESGLHAVAHPLLWAATPLADEQGFLFGGQLSASAAPWLLDHSIFSTPIFPGTGYLDAALCAAESLGLAGVPEMALTSPLHLAASTATQLQLIVQAESDDGSRAFSIRSQRAGLPLQSPWTSNGTGVLGDIPKVAIPAPESWPPADAVPFDLSGIYETFDQKGLGYGPAYRGLQAVWKTADAVYVSARLPESIAKDAAEFCIHPALLDTTLHGLAAVLTNEAHDGAVMLVAWQGVQLFCRGAVELRARLSIPTQLGGELISTSLSAWDEKGQPILSVKELTLHRVRAGQLRAAQARQSIYAMNWTRLVLPEKEFLSPSWVLGDTRRFGQPSGMTRVGGLDGLAEALRTLQPPSRVIIDAAALVSSLDLRGAHDLTHQVLRVFQSLLQEPRLQHAELVVLTEGAVSTNADEESQGVEPQMPWQAPIWGLLRSIRIEHPDRRIRVMDVDAESSASAILAALQIEDEPELALRLGSVYAPRLAPLVSFTYGLSAPARPALSRISQGTVLITGGTGELGSELARHLVNRYGARSLILVSRRGTDSSGTSALVMELTKLGANVQVVACDAANRQALSDVISSIPATLPLRAVFHCAAQLDDGLIMELTSERIDRVFAAKVDAAFHLHTLTESFDLDAFVFYSSIAGVMGSAGQANYAAANAFLDALSAYRRKRGLPGQSLAFGLWQSQGQGLSSKLSAHDLARLARQGLGEISHHEGLALVDAALERPESLLIPVRLSTDRLGQFADMVPAMLRLLVSVPRKQTPAKLPQEAEVELRDQLGALSTDEQVRKVLALLCGEVALVLGLASAQALSPEQSLRDLGIDSLMAVELRNRLQGRLGVRFELSAIWRISNLQEFAVELVRLISAQSRTQVGTLDAGAVASKEVDSSHLPKSSQSTALRPFLAPLSAGQQRLYFLDRVLTLRHTYNIAVAMRLPMQLDVDILRQAVEFLIARHEQLRVCFVEQAGQPKQRILPWLEAPIEEIVIDVAEMDRDRVLKERISAYASQPFDLARAPLFRVLYVRLAENESALSVIWHHITSDGASVAIFFTELSLAYQALLARKEPSLSVAPSYVKYVDRQRQWLESPACHAQRAFWKTKLDGLPALELPTDRTPFGHRTEHGDVVGIAVPADLTAAIEAVSKQIGSTPFVVLCAAWSAVLSRYSGQKDFAIGTTMLGRSDDSISSAVGFFVNTLPIRCTLDENTSGLAHIQRTHQEIWAALEHQDLPLDEIISEVSVERQQGFLGTPLFRTCVSYNETRKTMESFAGVATALLVDPVIEKVAGTSKFDLLLSVMRKPDGLTTTIEFSCDLFDRATIVRLSQHFLMLLGGMVNDSHRPVLSLPMLTPAEHQQLVYTWNDTQAAYPHKDCLKTRFESQASQRGDETAVVYDDLKLSYRELNDRANQLAHRLRSLGVVPDTLVALCVERSLDMVVGILGILKAGGAYVPIDPDSPEDRIRYIVTDTGTKLILTQRALLEKLPVADVMRLCLDDPHALDGFPKDNPPTTSSSANLAYVIYTSGSTGRPKGVLMEQHAVQNLLQALHQRTWDTAPMRAAMLAPVFFDMSVKPLFGALLFGHTLHVVDSETRRDGRRLLHYFARHAIQWADCTPSILKLLVEAGLPTYRLPALRVLLCGGEALPTSLVASIFAAGYLPDLQVVNVYGPTETCVNVNANSITAQTVPHACAVVPMGRPFENTQLYVLDAQLLPVPIGVPGELHIGGVGLARGYLNRPDLTQERFVPNPFVDERGARMYKTGDLVRWLPDGKIEFLGRRDFQVKIRGYRIELGEIESVLSSHALVASCVVMARESTSSDLHLVAYVVPQSGADLSADVLRSHLAKLLPEYMIPSAFVLLPKLPLSRNGKVDRKALPAPTSEEKRDSFVPPLTAVERALADILASVLGKTRLGRFDHFFALGGDSLLAVRAAARAQQAGFALSVQQIFRSPTLAQLGDALMGSTDGSYVMPLEVGRASGSILLFPGAGGVVSRIHEIAQAVSLQRSSFGLLSPFVLGIGSPPQSLFDLATLYAVDIAAHVPPGPLSLIGYSFGGVVALETAVQLASMQREVERVILLDSRPTVSQRRSESLEFDEEDAIYAIADTLGIPANRLQGAPTEHVLDRLTALLAPDLGEATGLRGFVALLVDSARQSMRMMRDWQPRFPRCAVHLVRVTQDDKNGPDYGWGQFGGLASVMTIPGQHYSILRSPYLETTLAAIRDLLRP